MLRTGFLTFCSLLLLAPAALAADNGEGYLGETTDKVVTFFSLGVMMFFVLVVVLGTLIQSRLEKRKDEQKAARLRGRAAGW